MEIEIDYTKSAQQNAEDYFGRSKKAKAKAKGAEISIINLEKQLKQAQEKQEKAKVVRKIEKREWYEKFNWFKTSNGLLAIGGKDAQQNELINSRHFDDNDLFFHANVFGASLVVLKEGKDTGEGVKDEAAQFAACFSRAWESGLTAVDVYSAKRNQVSKSSAKGSLATGSFLISGEREWYRNVKLELVAFLADGKLAIIPELAAKKVDSKAKFGIRQGNTKKSDAAKRLAKRLGYEDLDYIMQHLPAGSFSISNIM